MEGALVAGLKASIMSIQELTEQNMRIGAYVNKLLLITEHDAIAEGLRGAIDEHADSMAQNIALLRTLVKQVDKVALSSLSDTKGGAKGEKS